MESSIHAPLREFEPNQKQSRAEPIHTCANKTHKMIKNLTEKSKSSPSANGERKVSSMCKIIIIMDKNIIGM
jgi:hypothetical protein